MTPWLLYLVVVRAVLGSFSGFASVPAVREDLVVRHQVITDDQLNASIALSQTTPGPLGLYVVPVGYFALGPAGAVAAAAALVTPAFLAVPILWLVRRHHAATIRGAGAAIVIGSSLLMAAAALRLGPAAIPTPLLAGIAVAALLALITGRVSPVTVVVAAAVLHALAQGLLA